MLAFQLLLLSVWQSDQALLTCLPSKCCFCLYGRRFRQSYNACLPNAPPFCMTVRSGTFPVPSQCLPSNCVAVRSGISTVLAFHVQKPSWLTACDAHHDPLSHTAAGLMQVTEFQGVASEFLQRLKTTGPGLPNTDLAKGLELLKKFQVVTAAWLRLIARAAAYKLHVILVSPLRASL